MKNIYRIRIPFSEISLAKLPHKCSANSLLHYMVPQTGTHNYERQKPNLIVPKGNWISEKKLAVIICLILWMTTCRTSVFTNFDSLKNRMYIVFKVYRLGTFVWGSVNICISPIPRGINHIQIPNIFSEWNSVVIRYLNWYLELVTSQYAMFYVIQGEGVATYLVSRGLPEELNIEHRLG